MACSAGLLTWHCPATFAISDGSLKLKIQAEPRSLVRVLRLTLLTGTSLEVYGIQLFVFTKLRRSCGFSPLWLSVDLGQLSMQLKLSVGQSYAEE